jgi:phosphatidylinositol alpha-1,6-mannosyltransferase
MLPEPQLPRVLFVSKPIVPPWSDGSKCLVRDVAANLTATQGVVMTTAAVAPSALPENVATRAVYSQRGGFAPTLQDNARVLLHLLLKRDAELWHFVMAPNPRTCSVARALRWVRRVPVVQTIASQPRRFVDVASLLFGDVVVAQSHWTRNEVLAALPIGSAIDLQVIPPPVGRVAEPDPARLAALRQRFDIAETAPVFLYPGDLEVSTGARVIASLVEPLSRAVPGAVVFFACRNKTPRAAKVRAALEAELAGAPVRFAGELPDFHALVKAATAVLFPVDDLYGKVDLPIVLLEAMALGVPVVALAQGPLLDLRDGACLVQPGDQAGWTDVCVRLAQDTAFSQQVRERGRSFVAHTHDAGRVAASYERIYERLLASAGVSPKA